MTALAPPARIASLDAARGLAVLAMVGFHLTWDLGNFGYVEHGVPHAPGFKLLGHAIAISFLLIVGVSLVLAKDKGASAFWRRLALVAGAAALVSLGTYLMFPQNFVFFGILHCIAAASLLAAPFLTLPWPAALAVGASMLAAPLVFSHASFNASWLSWIGLATIEPQTNDYRPILPWAGYALLGVAAAQLWRARGIASLGDRWRVGPLGFLGRHSLAIYLWHQPALFALFYGLAAAGLAPPSEQEAYIEACVERCVEADVDARACRNLCACTAKRATTLTAAEAADPERRAARLDEIARACMSSKN